MVRKHICHLKTAAVSDQTHYQPDRRRRGKYVLRHGLPLCGLSLHLLQEGRHIHEIEERDSRSLSRGFDKRGHPELYMAPPSDALFSEYLKHYGKQLFDPIALFLLKRRKVKRYLLWQNCAHLKRKYLGHHINT